MAHENNTTTTRITFYVKALEKYHIIHLVVHKEKGKRPCLSLILFYFLKKVASGNNLLKSINIAFVFVLGPLYDNLFPSKPIVNVHQEIHLQVQPHIYLVV